MKILFVNPEYPNTFWSFKYALKFVAKKVAFPPLGLLTVASLLPEDWEKKLVDMSAKKLKDKDLQWADYVFIGAMSVQKESAKKIIERCRKIGVKTVAGGPLFTSEHEDGDWDGVSHFVLNEAEITLPMFLEDLKSNRLKRVYSSSQWADLETTPLPSWKLINKRHYNCMNIQYSRGCPFDCEFCDITLLYGRVPRTKSQGQILAELDALYDWGWRGSVFFVDDNFIGNKAKLKGEILPALIGWMEKKKHPFTFLTEASVNLADDAELMRMMAKAGFRTVFVGIETPDEEGLKECNKFQNKNRDLVDCVKRIQGAGMEVQAGFIVGFDSDTPSIFERQIEFIQKSGIVTAMVGLLGAMRGTRLYHRLNGEKRILQSASGNNTDGSLNFIPKMNRQALIDGYRKILQTIYSPKYYYERIHAFFREYRPFKTKSHSGRFRWGYVGAFLGSIWVLGVKTKGRIYYWKLFFWCLFKKPKLLPLAITFSIYRYHFENIFKL